MFKDLLNKFKSTSVNFLKFMRLVGDDNHWDWTTAALAATLFVLVFKVVSPGIGEISMFFLALMARAHKKQISAKHAQELDLKNAELAAKLEATAASLEAKLEEVSTEAAKTTDTVRTLKNDLGIAGLSSTGFNTYNGGMR